MIYFLYLENNNTFEAMFEELEYAKLYYDAEGYSVSGTAYIRDADYNVISTYEHETWNDN